MANNSLIQNIPIPSAEQRAQLPELQQKLLPFLTAIVSGQPVQGVTKRMAKDLMGMLTPDVLAGMAEKGYQVDPNWYRSYIPEGRVNPSTYDAITQYALSLATSNILPENIRTQAWQMYNEPPYQAAGFMPTYQQQRRDWAYTVQKMGLKGYVFNPYLNEWVYDPDIAREEASEAAKSLGLEGGWSDFLISDLSAAGIPTIPTAPGFDLGAAGIPTAPGFVTSYMSSQLPSLSGGYTSRVPGIGLGPRAQNVSGANYYTAAQPDVEQFVPYRDTWAWDADTIELANKLQVPVSTVQEAIGIIQDYMSAGIPPENIDQLLKARFGIGLDEFRKANPHWFHRLLIWFGLEPPREK